MLSIRGGGFLPLVAKVLTKCLVRHNPKTASLLLCFGTYWRNQGAPVLKFLWEHTFLRT